MKIFVLGATGKLGQEFVKEALENGDDVTAFVRNPQKITTESPNLKVIKGNIFDKNDIAASLRGHDSVVSCLGFDKKPQPVTGYLESAKAVVEAMRENGIKRLVYITAWFTDVELANARAGFFIRWVIIPMLKPVLLGMREMEIYIEKECQDIDYTVVRPPHLGTGEKTGKQMYAYEDISVETDAGSNNLNRSDVAYFLLSCLKENGHIKEMIAISQNKKK